MSSLRQEPALHTFKGLVHSEVYSVLLGHTSGMGIGVNTVACHGSETKQTQYTKLAVVKPQNGVVSSAG